MEDTKQSLEAAVAHHRAGRLTEAAALYRHTLEKSPNQPDALHLLGIVTHQLGDAAAAAALIQQAIAIAPEMPLFHNNLGKALGEQKKWEAAAASHRRAIELAPSYAEAWFNLGLVLQATGDLTGAEASYRRVIEITPDDPRAHNNLGLVFDLTHRLSEAVAAFRQALGRTPSNAGIWANLGRVQGKLGLVSEAVSSFRRSVELAPTDLAIRDQLIFHLLALPGCSNRDIESDVRAYGQAYPGPEPVPVTNDTADPKRRLRIGYLSGGLRAGHNLLYILEPLLRAHDRSQFEVFLYGDVPYASAAQADVRSLAEICRDTTNLEDDALADLIRCDRIDILVSLLGRGSGSPRHQVLFRKPAPVQMAYLWVSSTGIPAVDYWLADDAALPAASDETFHETIIRLPNIFIFQPPTDAPDVAPLPAVANGFVTFGSFSGSFKLNEELFAVWAKILEQLPTSRLLLKAPAFIDRGTRALFANRLTGSGVPAERVALLPPTEAFGDHLVHYNEIDIALDTFPYTFGNTAFESLWMGVPVVSLAGSRFASRISSSILHSARFDDLITASATEYFQRAVALASDIAALARWRRDARAALQASALMDPASHAKAIESTYRQAWQRRSAG